MIGNDVVDLQLAAMESDPKRKGFLDKLFTSAEQAAIANSPDPETTVWVLWSMKEAAYKIFNRQTGTRAFMPLRLETKILHDGDGEVRCGVTVYYTQTTLDNGIIYTVAVNDPNNFSVVAEAGYDEVIKDIRGLPYVNGKQASVSHHGKSVKAVFLQY